MSIDATFALDANVHNGWKADPRSRMDFDTFALPAGKYIAGHATVSLDSATVGTRADDEDENWDRIHLRGDLDVLSHLLVRDSCPVPNRGLSWPIKDDHVHGYVCI